VLLLLPISLPTPSTLPPPARCFIACDYLQDFAWLQPWAPSLLRVQYTASRSLTLPLALQRKLNSGSVSVQHTKGIIAPPYGTLAAMEGSVLADRRQALEALDLAMKQLQSAVEGYVTLSSSLPPLNAISQFSQVFFPPLPPRLFAV
jgi:hypothetical protein